MRVIAGTWRGRRLIAPEGQETRPTADRVREALFSMLGAAVAGARVLDLFAGSGALGIEALSRGASHVVFVERAPAALEAVRANLDALGVDGARAQLCAGDALWHVRGAGERGERFDLIMLDPPYGSPPDEELGRLLTPLLDAAGLLVCESAVSAAPFPALSLDRERRYGNTLIRIYRP
ncbi:MAG: 16S rRNA (guanine(966)-N(2))-methyltransferase RsmD [Solirubrobacteraceae bacterium]